MKGYVPIAEEIPRRAPKAVLSPLSEMLLIAAAAILIAVPCFWQPHIQAGDFSSHVYNAWLATRVEQGEIPGLTIHWQWSNVLADLVLPPLLRVFGRSGAERIVATAAVEIFFWGAFLFISRVSGRLPWLIAPSVAMLTYGTIFQLGFLNFYIGSGLSLWLLYVLWEPSWRRLAIALPVALAALLAHALPLAWAAGCLLYAYAARKIPENLRAILLVFGLLALAFVQTGLGKIFPQSWSWDQIFTATGGLSALGVGQFWPYDAKYVLVLAAMLLVWTVLFLERSDKGNMAADPIVHLWILMIASIALLPESIQFPGQHLPLEFIPDRISLFAAVLLCAVVSQGKHGRRITRFSCFLAAVFFSFLYLDARECTRVEKEIADLLAPLPRDQRISFFILDPGTRIDPVVHVASGVCIERCFDYGNYEIPSGAFRVRAIGRNPAATSDMRTVMEVEHRGHVVTPEEAPLYTVCPGDQGSARFKLKKLQAGESTCWFEMPILWKIF